MRGTYEMIGLAATRIFRAGVMIVALGAFETARAEETFGTPDVSFVDAGGGRVDLRDFRGRALVLNLWATWCAPCVRELPSLERLHESLLANGGQVAALSVDRGESAGVALFLRELGVSRLPVYLDATGGVMASLAVSGLPTTLLIDPEGREIGRLEGVVDWDSVEMRRRLRDYGFLPLGIRGRRTP
ncbi:cytochrome c biogenesis protein CcmG, thiol:disulfide interchange protein DsbE [Azospirillaceae bacterium]